jgi:hypothetical protein
MWVFSISCWLLATTAAVIWLVHDRKVQREHLARRNEWLRRIREGR